MCTLTFIPEENAYLLGMNRDEKIARGHASAPAVTGNGSTRALYPRDVEGGTWIAASDRGIAYALLNWNDTGVLHPKTRSRGSVIPELLNSNFTASADATLRILELREILPFRLIGFFPAEKQVTEWRWDQNSLERDTFIWSQRQWCSSSLSDAKATKRRGFSYARALGEADKGTGTWLRRLHASHDEEERPLSTCVHRIDVQTLSYTEFVCTPEVIHCTYLAGSPCSPNPAVLSSSIVRL